MNITDLFWNASLEELKKGYIEDKENFICLICGAVFEKGYIYNHNDRLMDSERAVISHMETQHINMFDFLVNMNKKYTGLTEHQKDIFLLFYEGLSDKDITKKIGGSGSTLRNMRFNFREKAKQAKIYLALMELLEEKISKSVLNKDKLIPVHRGATMIDERYSITEEERVQILKTHFTGEGKLIRFPKKEKRKIIILKEIVKKFQRDKRYTEKEINEIIKNLYDDYATIRRYLIEYGFMERLKDCSQYWVKN